jgi:hypothetical protein
MKTDDGLGSRSLMRRLRRMLIVEDDFYRNVLTSRSDAEARTSPRDRSAGQVNDLNYDVKVTRY